MFDDECKFADVILIPIPLLAETFKLIKLILSDGQIIYIKKNNNKKQK